MKTTAIITLLSAALFVSCSKKPAYDATGIFEATTVTVSAETQGKILSMDVEEGDSVTIGQQLCQIDTVLLRLQGAQVGRQISATTASIPDIGAQVASLEAQIAHGRQELTRQKNLLADGATTQKNYDDAKASLTALEGQLKALRSTLAKSSAQAADNAEAMNFQQAQVLDHISRSCVVSPLSGTVLEKYAEAGEYAVPGKPLLKIADLGKIYLRSYFTTRQLANIRIGQEVTVIADFGEGETYEYPGRITWIAAESEFTPKSIQTEDSRANLVYAVRVSVKNDGRLKLGQYGEVRL